MDISMAKSLFFLILSLSSILGATERMPWYPRYLELQPRATYRFQEYSKVDTKEGTRHHGSHDHFLHLSLSAAYDRWCAEIEATGAATRHENFNLADLSLTGRYLWLDDVVGDAVSLTTGLTVTQVITLARHDISCFYHGGIEVEGHVAVGKELTLCEEFWRSRLWGVVGFGVADLGSPWVRANMAWEHNVWDRHRVRLFVASLWGLGHRDLKIHHFRGFGPIRHQLIDLGLLYGYHFECGFSVDVGYAYRVYARNCPLQANQFLVSLLYPFGL